jgi:hypothetical protein
MQIEITRQLIRGVQAMLKTMRCVPDDDELAQLLHEDVKAADKACRKLIHAPHNGGRIDYDLAKMNIATRTALTRAIETYVSGRVC